MSLAITGSYPTYLSDPSGGWSPGPVIVIGDDASVTADGVRINAASVGETVRWEAARGNPSSASLLFVRTADGPYPLGSYAAAGEPLPGAHNLSGRLVPFDGATAIHAPGGFAGAEPDMAAAAVTTPPTMTTEVVEVVEVEVTEVVEVVEVEVAEVAEAVTEVMEAEVVDSVDVVQAIDVAQVGDEPPDGDAGRGSSAAGSDAEASADLAEAAARVAAHRA